VIGLIQVNDRKGGGNVVRRVQRSPKAPHPTKTLLLHTAVQLLATTPFEDLTIDMVLEASGVSRGPLYHHYEDFPDLLEHALVAIFATHVDESIEVFERAVDTATSKADLADRVNELTRVTQQPGRAARRMQRIVVFANAQNSPRLRSMLGEEQQRLTSAMADAMARAQAKGWINPDVHPRALAAFVQAYTLGRVVDDIDPTPVPPDEWIRLVDSFIASVFINSSPSS
jgi:AcrR family transcriptional regulator